ncbi:UPF0262 family protein [Pararhizobium sp. YC-54]|uniref:UPF0262 family protein n=1 Tax=Pararhizobium sp. YC-54 TaxID=2986920 RepID=UPI0021F7398B|nr:UPF0262 family protein [Pararhizobium sp. YC-54]MCW0001584.1 UPF0262 family protein [Pararhizobium sp. YC-54]
MHEIVIESTMNFATPPVTGFRLSAVSVVPSFGNETDPAQRCEQTIAIRDLLENNNFVPIRHGEGPYRLPLALTNGRLVISATTEHDVHVMCHSLSLSSFRSLFRDYRLVCESYATAKMRMTPHRIEAIDMGRRAIHDEASALLIERLKSNVAIDLPTARRLFTLIHLLVSNNAYRERST